jgi:hypothetical protein
MWENPKRWIKRLPTNPIAAAERARDSRSALSHVYAMLFSIIPTITHNNPAINKRELLETPGLYLSTALLLEIGFIRIKMVGQRRNASLREFHLTFTIAHRFLNFEHSVLTFYFSHMFKVYPLTNNIFHRMSPIPQEII